MNSTKEPCHFVLLNSITITRQACPLRAPSNQLTTTKQKVPLSHGMRCGTYRMFFLPAFITLSKGYYHCERLACSRHRPLNLPETRRISQRWQNAGPVLIGQTGEKKPRIGGRADGRPEPLPSAFILINYFAVLHKCITLMQSTNSPISFPN